MVTTNKSRFHIALATAAFVFIACTFIAFSSMFKVHPERLSLAITLDLLITAPLAYYLVIRRTAISKLSVLRVFIAGVLLAGVLLSKSNTPLLSIIKTWISPLVELTLIGYLVWKFLAAKRQVNAINQYQNDFLVHCRAILREVLGNERIANVLASEIAVFYYIFSKRDRAVDYSSKFTGYKENGIVLVLYTFLCLFVIETTGMHFLFLLWNKTAAWIFTSLSLYTCLQLLAHIKALKARPHVLTDNQLLLRNGLMGGDALVSLDNIAMVERTNKQAATPATVKIALIKGLENHNFAIHLIAPVGVTKAFGIKKTAKVLLVYIDKPEAFVEMLEGYKVNFTS